MTAYLKWFIRTYDARGMPNSKHLLPAKLLIRAMPRTGYGVAVFYLSMDAEGMR